MDFLLSELSTAFQENFPAWGPFAPLRVLGSGFSSVAVGTPNGLVLRVARTAQAGLQYAREAAALPRIAPLLPVPVPQPVLYHPGAPVFPFGVIGYARLPGAALEMEQARTLGDALAEQAGVLIYALQFIPVELLPWRDDFAARQAGWLRQREMAMPVLRAALSAGEARRVADWWEALLSDEAMGIYTPVVQHGDLWFGNLLVEGQRISGLIDFQEMDAGDPALDFCPQLYLGEAFLRRVIASYQAAGGVFDAGFLYRLERLWGLREFGGLIYAVEQADSLEFADALEKIRKGPILSRRGLDGWG